MYWFHNHILSLRCCLIIRGMVHGFPASSHSDIKFLPFCLFLYSTLIESCSVPRSLLGIMKDRCWIKIWIIHGPCPQVLRGNQTGIPKIIIKLQYTLVNCYNWSICKYWESVAALSNEVGSRIWGRFLEGVTSEWNRSLLGRGNIRYRIMEAWKNLYEGW